MTTNGMLTTLFSFSTNSTAVYMSGLTQASDGNFYGTTRYGSGAFGWGTVFRMTPTGVLTNMFSFDSDYGLPVRPIQASDGNFYGLAGDYGRLISGIVYKMTPDGSWTILVSFNGTDVAGPLGALVQGTDGNFYGTTAYGGDLSLSSGRGGGTVFRIVMPPPPPTLTIAQDGNQMVLSWPTNAAEFVLVAADSLSSSTTWSTNSDTPIITGDQNTITVSNSAGSKFYRLRK